MTLHKYQNRKEYASMFLVLSLVLTVQIYWRYDTGNDFNIPLLLAWIANIFIFKFYLDYRRQLTKRYFVINDSRIVIKDIVSYAAVEEGVRVSTTNSEHLYKVKENDLEDFKLLQDIVLRELDLAMRYGRR